MTSRRPTGRTSLAVASLLAISSLTTFATPATAEPSPSGQAITPGPTPADIRTPGDPVAGPATPTPAGPPLPTPAQRQAVSALGEVTARWNGLGTPASILPEDGSLGAAVGDPAAAARAWLVDHAAAFGMTTAQVDGLRAGQLPAAGRLRRARRAVPPGLRWRRPGPRRARDRRRRRRQGRLRLLLPGPDDRGHAGRHALPRPGLAEGRDGARRSPPTSRVRRHHEDGERRLDPARPSPASPRSSRCACGRCRWPTAPCVRSSRPTSSTSPAVRRSAFTSLVDGVTGKVLARHNKTENFAYTNAFQGAVPGTACGPKHPFELDGRPDAHHQRRRRRRPCRRLRHQAVQGDTLVTTADTATNPEVATYTAAPIPGGTYSAQVCASTPARWPGRTPSR